VAQFEDTLLFKDRWRITLLFIPVVVMRRHFRQFHGVIRRHSFLFASPTDWDVDNKGSLALGDSIDYHGFLDVVHRSTRKCTDPA
jgi:hypothetical protein